jgi:hypothetical protein
MKTSLDIQAWRNKYIYLLKEEDEFDEPINVSYNWNIIELSVGDDITRDMWDDEAVIAAGEEDEFLNDEYWTIEHIGNGYVEIKSDQGGYIDWKIENVQALLKPDYKIVTKKNVFESDDFDNEFDVSSNWNEFEGKVVITFVVKEEGYIYVDEEDEEEFSRLNPNVKNNFNFDGYDDPIRSTVVYESKPISIKDLNHWLEELVGISPQPYTEDQTTEGFKEWMKKNNIEIDSLVYLYDILKPTEIKTTYSDDNGNSIQITDEMKEKIEYGDDGVYYGDVLDVKFDNDLNESDDFEDEINVSDNWNVTELRVGDVIHPKMLNDKEYGKKYLPYPVYIQDIFKNLDDEISVAIGNTTTKSWISDFYLTTVNDWLKPEYKIIHDELNESDDDWDIKVSNHWGGLGVGDIITPDMWKEDVSPHLSQLTKLNLRITDFFNEDDIDWVEYVAIEHGHVYAEYVDYINRNLKPEYKIIHDELNESDDDWDIEVDNKWNLSHEDEELLSHYEGKWELTDEGLIIKGDLDLQGTKIKSLGNLISVDGGLGLEGTKIESLGNLQYVGGPLIIYKLNINSFENLQYVGGYLQLSDTPISKKYTEEQIRQMVVVVGKIYGAKPSLNESDEFDNEFEINDWGKKELRIGDTITPDIWEDTMEAGWEYPVYIKDVDEDEDGVFVTIIKNDTEEIWDADELNGWMKPGYEITPF